MLTGVILKVNTSAIDHLLYKAPAHATGVTGFIEGVKARL